jgi:cobalt-zinc-cadmium efflux system protein
MTNRSITRPYLVRFGRIDRIRHMSHDHHHHHHGPAAGDFHRAFAWAVALNIGYVLVEAGFGIWSNSLALLADAGHNFSDVLGLLLAWAAHYLAQAKPTKRRTYGWRSSSILAAVLNSLLLLLAIGGISWEAISRMNQPGEVHGLVLTAVAGVGVVINTLTALLFLRGRKEDLNIKGAYLHMAADAAVSGGVVVSGLVIYFTGWTIIDPLCSLVIVLVILLGTWSLFRESVNLMLHAVPAGIDPRQVARFLADLPGVVEIHDLHIWAMSTTETALTVHLVKPAMSNEDEFLAETAHELTHQFGIHHATMQIERGTGGCPVASAEVV